MTQDWQLEEKDEHISQGVLLLSKLLLSPYDCALRTVCESYIEAHKSYMPEVAKEYDISKLDGDERHLGF